MSSMSMVTSTLGALFLFLAPSFFTSYTVCLHGSNNIVYNTIMLHQSSLTCTNHPRHRTEPHPRRQPATRTLFYYLYLCWYFFIWSSCHVKCHLYDTGREAAWRSPYYAVYLVRSCDCLPSVYLAFICSSSKTLFSVPRCHYCLY
jgi:hypothetical protein